MATNGNVSSPEYYPYADSVASSTNPLAGRSSPQPGPSQAPPDYPGVGADIVGSTEAGARRDGEEERQGEVSWVHVFRARGNLVCGGGVNVVMSLAVAVASVASNSTLSCTTSCGPDCSVTPTVHIKMKVNAARRWV